MEEYQEINKVVQLDSKYIDLMVFKLNRYFRRINDFELLYTPEAAEDIFIEIMSRNFNTLYLQLAAQINTLNLSSIGKWKDTNETTMNNTSNSNNTDNIDEATNSRGSDTEGYSGYDVSNQSGDFRTNKNENSASTNRTSTSNTTSDSTSNILTGRTDNIRYLEHFNKQLDAWAMDVVFEVRRNITKGVY